MASIKRDIASGLIVVAPVAVTLLVIQYLFRFIAGLPVVSRVTPPALRVLVVLVVFVLLVTATGWTMRTAVGVLLVDLIEAGINRIPGLRMVYNASRLAIETVFSGSGRRAEPVKVESWEGLWVNAFDTGNRTEDGRVLCFFPTAPNITTGYVIEVEEEHIKRTGESLEGALLRIISAGFGDRSGTAENGPPVDGVGTAKRVHGVEFPDSNGR